MLNIKSMQSWTYVDETSENHPLGSIVLLQIGSYFNEEQLVRRLQVEVVCLNVVGVDTNCSLDVLFL